MKIKDMLDVKQDRDAGLHQLYIKRERARGVLAKGKGPSGQSKPKSAVTGRRQRRAKARRKSGRR